MAAFRQSVHLIVTRPHLNKKVKMKFDINNKVKVKLTEVGKSVLREQYKVIKAVYPWLPDFVLPDEDENGWSKWQLWELMQKFGHVMYNGGDIPFETEIEIIEDQK